MNSTERRIAILLNAMGGDTVDKALAEFDSARADQIREAAKQLKESPPSIEEEDEVLNDFESFFRFAVETANVPSSWMTEVLDQEVHDAKITEVPEEEEILPPPKPKLKLFTPTDDPYYDLKRLKPIQIAGALKDEFPKTIALVLETLDGNLAAEVIRELPDELQPLVFLQIKEQPTAPGPLVEQILRATVKLGSQIEIEKTVEPDVNQKLAELLRSMPKDKRGPILDEIRGKDPEAAEQIGSLLYTFEDILTFDDRSIQKLLGEIETATLVVALQDTVEELSDKILQNLSKRARSSLMEELELSGKKPDDEVEEARKTVADAIAKLDQAGQLAEM